MFEMQTTDNRELTITDELKQLVERAERGDQSALPELRKALDDNPALWAAYGNLARAAERAWISLTAGENLMLAESLTRQLEVLKAELAGPGEPTPLEHLLIQRITACWLQAHYADAFFAQLKWGTAGPGYFKTAALLQDRAHRRLLAAAKQLALVRKLLRPAAPPVQIIAHWIAERPGALLAGGDRTGDNGAGPRRRGR